MVMLPFEPRPFFAHKDRAFWNLQLAGWGGALLLRAITGFANGQSWDFLVDPVHPGGDGVLAQPDPVGGLSPAHHQNRADNLGRDRDRAGAGRGHPRLHRWLGARSGAAAGREWLRPAVPRHLFLRSHRARRVVGALLRDQFLSGRSRNRPTGSNGSRRRPPARNWRCCAISSTRTSCSTRSIRSARWCC